MQTQDEDHKNKKFPRLKRCGTICVKYIFDAAHILVVRGKRSQIWSLPKGCIDAGETELQCAQRETLEEAGLNLDLSENNLRVTINHNVYFIVIITTHPKLKTKDRAEIDKVNWMTLEEIKGLQCNKDLRSILQYPMKKFSFHNILHNILRLNTLEDSFNMSDLNLALNDNMSSEEEFEKVTDEKIIDEKMVDEKISYDPPPGLDFENQE